MASNRPLFDDEELPLWLKNGGITHAGHTSRPQQSNAPTPSATPAEDLSWLDDHSQPAATSAASDNSNFNSSTSWMQDAAPAEAEAASSSDLPPWMQNIAPAEPMSQAAPAAPVDIPPWMQNVAPAEPIATPSEELPPWMQDAAPASPALSTPPDADLPTWARDEAPPDSTVGSEAAKGGLTGMLPWRQGASDAGATLDDPFADVSGTAEAPWQQDSSGVSEPTQPEPTFNDSWLQSENATVAQPEPAPEPAKPPSMIRRLASTPPTPEQAAPPTPAPQQVTADDLSWLDDAIKEAPAASQEPMSPPASQPPTPPSAPKSEPKLVKPLSALPSLQPADSSPTESAPAEPPKSRPSIKKLAAVQPEQPAEPAPPASRPAIKKLGAAPPSQAVQPDLSNMTYEDWEQSQAEKEQAAQADPNDKLLDEVPDWFSGAGTQPPAAQGTAPGGAEFMPEWFVGMEEPSHDAAPDWFNKMDLNSTPLVGPDTVQTPQSAAPASTPATMPPAADDVPDWFKGSVEGAGDLDFNAMFVADAPEPPPSSSKLSLKLSERAPEPSPSPSAAEVEPPQQEPVAQARPIQPVQSMQSAEPEPISAPVAEEPELDWMSEMPALDDLVETQVDHTPEAPQAQPAQSARVAQSAEPDWFAEVGEPEAAPSIAGDPLDWLSGESTTDTPQPELAAAEADDLPDWMRSAAPGDATTSGDQSGGDNWMGSLTSELAAASASPSMPDAEEADLPDWMRELGPADAATPAEPVPAVSQGSGMDWLEDFAALPPESQQPPVLAVQSETPAESQVDWLAQTSTEGASGDSLDLGSASMDIDALLSLSTPPPVAVEPEPTMSLADTDVNFDEMIVPHLGEEPSAEAFEPSEFMPLPSAPSPQPMPAMMDSTPEAPVVEPEDPDAQFAPLPSSGRLKRLATSDVPAAAPEAQTETGQAVPREQLPEWVSELNPSAGPTVLHIGDQEIRMQDKPLVEVANALRPLRERSKAVGAQKPSEGSVASGPLAGITDAIDIAPETAQPRTVIGPDTRVMSDLHAQRVKIVQNMLGLEEQRRKERAEAEDKREAKAVVAAPTRARIKVDRFVVTILLALAVLAPFFTGALIVPMPDTSQLSPALAAVSDTIGQMKSGQSALVAFEYGPTGAGELDDLARTVIRALVKQGVQPVIVSTNPSGAIHAQQLMAQLGAQTAQLDALGRTGKPLVARQDYVVLRFLPGGVTGVRSLLNATLTGDFGQITTQAAFRTDIEGKASNLTDISRHFLAQNPVFVLAESPEDVRNWVEQWNDPVQHLRIVLLSSASASAVAQAYTADKRIIGPMVGLRDAMIFQALKQPVNDPKAQTLAVDRWQSIGLASLLAALIILFGTAFNVIRNYQRRGRR